MEQQISQSSQNSPSNTASSLNWNKELPSGTSVVYGLNGKCTVVAIESRDIAGQNQRFYKLERQKSPLSRSTREEPAIWLPVQSAKTRGLRAPMTASDIDAAFEIFSNREHFFSTKDTWVQVQNQMDESIRSEGSLGMAKALSYIFVLKKRQFASQSEVSRYAESVQKVLFREISDITGETYKQIEDKITRAMRHKLLADH